jgi:hypothetical protein
MTDATGTESAQALYDEHHKAAAELEKAFARQDCGASILAFAEVLRERSLPTRHLLGFAASKLASVGTAPHWSIVLRAYLRGPANLELAAMLLQELVIRQKVGPCASEAAQLQAHLEHVRHPLASLPHELLLIETGIDLPFYSHSGSSWERASPGEAIIDAPPIERSADAVPFTESAAPLEVFSAVENWRQASNGSLQATQLRFARAVNAGEACRAVEASSMAAAKGVSAEAMVRRVTVADFAYRTLFSAASCGGAYNCGLFGAYGRLATWRTLAALLGFGNNFDHREVEQAAERGIWFDFGCMTAWFCDVAWDIGLAVLRADRQSMALLAATDTD